MYLFRIEVILLDLKEIMQLNTFAVVGNTIDQEKYAYKIKNGLQKKGYITFGVWKEYNSIDEIEEEIDVICLCINSKWGLKYLKECKKEYKCIVIQPGAESEELIQYLNDHEIVYIEGCLLVGLRLYAKEG